MTTTTSVLGGRWRLGEVLGRGAVADVFAAHDLASGGSVAVKVLRSADAEAMGRFDREVEVLRGIDHPRIVRLLASGDDGPGGRYLVLERLAGGSLAQRLASGPLAAEEVVTLAVDLAEGLAHAHASGLVHRDLKPANVLLDADGRAKLSDFGIARLVGAEALTATGCGVGTPAYVAPEQLRGDEVGPAADVYALGLVLLEAATGARAFPGDGLPAALARLERGPVVPADLPTALAAVLSPMVAADPADRPAASAVAARLGRTADDATALFPVAATATAALPVVAPRTTAPFTRARRRRWWPATVAAALVVVVAAWALARDEVTPPAPPSPTTTALVVSATSTTTAPPPTAPPATEVEPPAGPGPGPGNGNGNGNGRGGNRPGG